MAPSEQFMGGRKGELLKIAHGESEKQFLQLPTSVAGTWLALKTKYSERPDLVQRFFAHSLPWP